MMKCDGGGECIKKREKPLIRQRLMNKIHDMSQKVINRKES